MAKRYIRLNWQNKPSVKTPVNETNLNIMDKGIDDIDNAIEEIYAKRVNNTITTNPDTFVAGPVAKNLQDQVNAINNNLGDLDSQLAENTQQISSKANNTKFINMSIDDFELALKDITTNSATYTSIFQGEIFGKMKELHDAYGVKFSCFCFSNNTFDITTTTTKFKSEFQANADWLKFGFHGKDINTTYNIETLANFKVEYDKTIQAIKNFAGEASLCKAIRLSSFYGTADVVNELSTVYGIKGLFCADDLRVSYDLTTTENDKLNMNYVLRKNNMNYFKTLPRLDSETVETILPKLEKVNKINILALFFHEKYITTYLATITESLKWANANGYIWDDFGDLPSMSYLAQTPASAGIPLPTDLTYTLYSGWAIRSGSKFQVKSDGKRVHLQGQLIKSTDITSGDPCIGLDASVVPPTNLIVPVVCFPDSGSTAQSIVGIMQTNRIFTIGYRDLVASAGNRCVSISVSFYID